MAGLSSSFVAAWVSVFPEPILGESTRRLFILKTGVGLAITIGGLTIWPSD